jgi:hypothetical protein
MKTAEAPQTPDHGLNETRSIFLRTASFYAGTYLSETGIGLNGQIPVLARLIGYSERSSDFMKLNGLESLPVIFVGDPETVGKQKKELKLSIYGDDRSEQNFALESDRDFINLGVGERIKREDGCYYKLFIHSAENQSIFFGIKNQPKKQVLLVSYANVNSERPSFSVVNLPDNYERIFAPDGRLLSQGELTALENKQNQPDHDTENQKKDILSPIDQFSHDILFTSFEGKPVDPQSAVISLRRMDIDAEQYYSLWPKNPGKEYNPSLEVISVGNNPQKDRDFLDELYLVLQGEGNNVDLEIFRKDFNYMVGKIGKAVIYRDGMVIQNADDPERIMLKNNERPQNILVIRTVNRRGERSFVISHICKPPENFRALFNPETGVLYTESELNEITAAKERDFIRISPENNGLSAEGLMTEISDILGTLRVSQFGSMSERKAFLGEARLPVTIRMKIQKDELRRKFNRDIQIEIAGLALLSPETIVSKYQGKFALDLLKKARVGFISGKLVYEIKQDAKAGISVNSWIERSTQDSDQVWIRDPQIITTKYNNLESVLAFARLMKSDVEAPKTNASAGGKGFNQADQDKAAQKRAEQKRQEERDKHRRPRF